MRLGGTSGSIPCRLRRYSTMSWTLDCYPSRETPYLSEISSSYVCGAASISRSHYTRCVHLIYERRAMTSSTLQQRTIFSSDIMNRWHLYSFACLAALRSHYLSHKHMSLVSKTTQCRLASLGHSLRRSFDSSIDLTLSKRNYTVTHAQVYEHRVAR
jgi:hypothetical protein